MVDLLQWPAMAATLTAAWLIASQSKHHRRLGFWCFMFSNLLWVFWGWHDAAYGLIAMQVGLFLLNLRGKAKNEPKPEASTTSSPEGAEGARGPSVAVAQRTDA